MLDWIQPALGVVSATLVAIIALGFGAMFIGMRFDYQRLNRRWIVYGALLLTIFLLLAVFAFSPVNGARRWIKFGGMSAQPSEIAKLARLRQQGVLTEEEFQAQKSRLLQSG